MTDERAERLKARELHVCSFCRPNRGENKGRVPKHGVKKKRKRSS